MANEVVAPIITGYKIEITKDVIPPVDTRVFKTIMLNGRLFRVDESYLDEPLDNVYPIYDIDTGEEVGRFQANALQQTALKIPDCWKETYVKRISPAIAKAYSSIEIYSVLRLIVNNERYIHYLIGPALMDELIVREGGQYFAFVDNVDGEPVLYAGNTALELRENIRHKIFACKARGISIVHDVYFQEAIAKLLASHLTYSICAKGELYSTWKEVKDPTDTEHNHEPHCKWCMEMGLDGKHTNYWATDGNVYEDRTKRTTKSNYIKPHKH